MYGAKYHNSEPRIHLTGNSKFSESSKLSLWPFWTVSLIPMKNLDIWNSHRSLTINNGKLIWYFRRPLCAIMLNVTHFLIPFGMREKNGLFELCSIVLMQNLDLWNFYSSPALINGKLRWYFISLWYAIVFNMAHFYILFGMKEKWPFLNCVFHLYLRKIKTFGIFKAHWLWIMGN